MTDNELKNSYQERMERSNNIISETLGEVFKKPDLFESFLDIMGKFNYSACDSLIIAKTYPNASLFMTFDEWNKNGYWIIKDETGYTFPDFDNGKEVWFDASQTRPLENSVPIKKPEDTIRTQKEKLRSLMSNNRFRFLTVSKPEHTKGKPAYFDSKHKVIFIDRTVPFEVLYPALAAEIAHSYLWQTFGETYNRDSYETAAQMASYVICKKNSIKTGKIQITKNLQNFTPEQVKAFLDNVRAISDKVGENIQYFYQNGKDRLEPPIKKLKLKKAAKTQQKAAESKQETSEEKETENKTEDEHDSQREPSEPFDVEFTKEVGTDRTKLLPLLKSTVLHHNHQIDEFAIKKAYCEDKIKAEQKKMEKLGLKAEHLETTVSMLEILLERTDSQSIKSALAKRISTVRKRAANIKNIKIPKCKKKIESCTVRIEYLNKKIKIINCKIDRCENLDNILKSLTMTDNTKRSSQFIKAMNGLHDSSISLLKNKIEFCTVKIKEYNKQYSQSESQVEKQKIQNKVLRLNAKCESYVDKVNKLNKLDSVIIPDVEQSQNVTDKVMNNAENVIHSAVESDNTKSIGALSDSIVESSLELLNEKSLSHSATEKQESESKSEFSSAKKTKPSARANLQEHKKHHQNQHDEPQTKNYTETIKK